MRLKPKGNDADIRYQAVLDRLLPEQSGTKSDNPRNFGFGGKE